jgi:hypothetical protein
MEACSYLLELQRIFQTTLGEVKLGGKAFQKRFSRFTGMDAWIKTQVAKTDDFYRLKHQEVGHPGPNEGTILFNHRGTWYRLYLGQAYGFIEGWMAAGRPLFFVCLEDERWESEGVLAFLFFSEDPTEEAIKIFKRAAVQVIMEE